ncbi:MAG: conjugal transfer protein TraX [Alphaproteobacteria bacterium]|nr:conjugal transfer protein TraX [Alphaproteobacteria bacterium]
MSKLIKTYEYGKTPNTYDIFKAIAIVTMVIDHIGYYLFPEILWFRVVGRIAFPIFLFLVGYSRSYQFDKWLLFGALIVLASHALNGVHMLPLNILFSILVWRIVMGRLNKTPKLLNDLVMLWVAMLVFYIPGAFLLEYSVLGMIFAVLGWHVREGRNDMAIRIAWLFTVTLWIAEQSLIMGFKLEHIALLIVEGVLLNIAMMQFSMRNYPLPPAHETPSPTFYESCVILLARNSLLIYVVHVVAIQTYAHYLYPDRYGQMFKIF